MKPGAYVTHTIAVTLVCFYAVNMNYINNTFIYTLSMYKGTEMWCNRYIVGQSKNDRLQWLGKKTCLLQIKSIFAVINQTRSNCRCLVGIYVHNYKHKCTVYLYVFINIYFEGRLCAYVFKYFC